MKSKNSVVIPFCPALRLPLLLLSGVAIALGLLVGCSDEPAIVEGSSLLLITIDTTRADALGCYGGPEGLTPVLDALAGEGVRFDQARAVAPVTLPSHATIVTGLLPFEHGIRDNATFVLPEDVSTLAERLKEKDYTTLAVMGAFVLHSTFGLDQGFDVYSDVPLRQLTLSAAEDQRRADEVVDEALRLLRSIDGERPFFLWAHFFDPHFPYTPPRDYFEKAPAATDRSDSAKKGSTRQAYLGEVAFMDHEIGRLIDGVRDRVPRGRLLTAVVSDHGEALGDHGESTHGFLLHDSTVLVPMILQHDGLPRGKIVTCPVSTNDLAPSVLSLLGMDFDGMTGRDLSLLLTGQEEGTDHSIVYFEGAYPFFNFNWCPLFGAVEGRFKFIDGPAPALFDMEADPGEGNNIFGQQEERIDRMRDTFRKLSARMRPPKRSTLSRKDQGRIRALGYAGSSLSTDEEMPMPPGEIREGLLDPAKGMEIWNRWSNARSLAASRSSGDLKKAVSLMRGILKEDPQNPTFKAHAGTVFFQAGLYSEAAGLLRKSLETLESATSRETLASCLMNLDRMDEAIVLLEVNARLHPFDLVTRFKLGEALISRRRVREGLAHLDFFLREHEARDRLHAIAEEIKLKGLKMLGLQRGGEGR